MSILSIAAPAVAPPGRVSASNDRYGAFSGR